MEHRFIERLKQASAATALCLGALAIASCGDTPPKNETDTHSVDSPSDNDFSRQLSDFIYESYYGEKPKPHPVKDE